MQPAPAEHYENFPVASWLCPAALRPAVSAIYWFARTADDIADEGDAPAADRLADLAAYRAELDACLAGRAVPAPRWPRVFGPLAAAARRHALPAQPLHDLLDAFAQDVRRTAAGEGYADMADLLDYCRRSANPVGRLMLHLYGVRDAQALAQSDAICTALQLANFWQDLSVDIPRGRHYLPADRLRALGLDAAAPASWAAHPNAPKLIAEQCLFVRANMQKGWNLPFAVPGRAGWELRAVVQGGLRIVDRVEALGAAAFRQRPAIGRADAALIAWRCLQMRRAAHGPVQQSRP